MISRLITPLQFKDYFKIVVEESERTISELWNKFPDYSRLMLGTYEKPGLLNEVAKKLNLQSTINYWSFDSIFYTELITEFFSDDYLYVNYASVAIEHENVINYSHNEISKLSLLNCPLKVLITYPKKETDIETYLTHYAKIIKLADVFNDFSSLRKQLIIFGESFEDYHNKWSYYVYNGNEGFDEI